MSDPPSTPPAPPTGRSTAGPRRPDYRGEPLDAARGPGLGCFWSQAIILVALVILTPLSVWLGWPSTVSAVLLVAVVVLLFFVGQTVIFLLRLVAADRRSRRRPLRQDTSPTVGELEDGVADEASPGASPQDDEPEGGPGDRPMRE